tara:strand:+ start:32 stop:244 length:213 start_codon:yes stop_codon:yes gene_type:complete
MARVNLNPTNSKVINGVVFVTALKVKAMSEVLVEESIKFGNRITHPSLGTMYQYDGKYSRNSIKVQNVSI